MAPEQFSLLLEKFLAEELDSKELPVFLSAAKDPSNHELLHEVIGDKLEGKAYSGLSESLSIDDMFQQMLAKVEGQTGEDGVVVTMSKRISVFTFSRVAAAAVVLILLLAGVYFLFPGKKQEQMVVQSIGQRGRNDVAPGHQGAILTLSDGQQIVLDSAHNGTIASQGNTDIIKENNVLAYKKESNTSEVVYNTMTTPRGRQYRLVLTDGSKVWLNAASSITFPTAFTGDERRVQLRGEAYFEVAKNAAMPFKVEVGKMEVKVLGTHFNVKAYDDEYAIKTTLLEGSVLVAKGNVDALLKPGQEAILNYGGENFKVDEANVEEAVAWKNGLFQFNNASIVSIMRQLSRWYGIEVVFRGEVVGKSFSGVVSQNTSLSQVLKMLQLTKEVHFKMEGSKVIVSP